LAKSERRYFTDIIGLFSTTFTEIGVFKGVRGQFRPKFQLEEYIYHEPFCTYAVQLCRWQFSHKETL